MGIILEILWSPEDHKETFATTEVLDQTVHITSVGLKMVVLKC